MVWRKRFGLEVVAVAAMAAVVAVLGVYQYRWTGEISRNEQARLRTSLAGSVRGFGQEFSYDLQALCERFELEPAKTPAQAEEQAVQQYAAWTRTSANAKLVRGLYLTRLGESGGATLRQFDPEKSRFRDAAWPPELAALQRSLSQPDSAFPAAVADRDAVYFPWTFSGASFALLRPVFQAGVEAPDGNPSLRTSGVLIVELDRQVFRDEYIPGLIERHFGAPGQRSFAVTVTPANAPAEAIYQTDPKASGRASPADAAVNLFDLVSDEARRRGHPALQAAPGEGAWELQARHPAGSLEEAVAAWRRRNLAVSLGLLGVLAVGMALVFTAARRSKALARMQMEFVAGVSHELCTPLAVINAAAENLADGVVDDPVQMREYGGLIRSQGRRLGRLVDEVLLFTAGRFGLSGYDVAPVDFNAILRQCLATSEGNLRDAQFTVDTEVDPALPPILADASAAITCVENLLSNAIKYSNGSKRVRIHATLAPGGSKPEVRVSVEDRGMGIPARDLPHIFEPFYRVAAVRENQIRGVGLGLYLVKRMMEDMGGRVSVTSSPGRGTEAVLYFPAAVPPERSGAAGETREPPAHASADASLNFTRKD